MTGLTRDLMHQLYGCDIWKDFKGRPVTKIEDWNSTHPALTRLAKDAELIIDVGVWKGLSTVTLANALKAAGTDGCVIAVDTFLGSSEHWYVVDRINGYPTIYQTFMEHMQTAGVSEYVLPMPQTSTTAAHILKQLYIQPDLVHLDASHLYDDVKRDIEAYLDLLLPGGHIIGDDYDWVDVKKAADEFALNAGLQLEVDGPKWIVRKPINES